MEDLELVALRVDLEQMDLGCPRGQHRIQAHLRVRGRGRGRVGDRVGVGVGVGVRVRVRVTAHRWHIYRLLAAPCRGGQGAHRALVAAPRQRDLVRVGVRVGVRVRVRVKVRARVRPPPPPSSSAEARAKRCGQPSRPPALAGASASMARSCMPG